MKNIISIFVCAASLLLVIVTFPSTISKPLNILRHNKNSDVDKAIIMPSNKNLHNIRNKNESKDF